MIELRVSIVPPSPNERKYKNYHAYARLRDLWEEEIYHAISGRRRNELLDFARSCKMQLSVNMHLAKLRDQDNLIASLKPLIDALKRCGYIHDDSPQWLELKAVTQELTGTKYNAGSEIRLTPEHKKENDPGLKKAA